MCVLHIPPIPHTFWTPEKIKNSVALKFLPVQQLTHGNCTAACWEVRVTAITQTAEGLQMISIEISTKPVCQCLAIGLSATNSSLQLGTPVVANWVCFYMKARLARICVEESVSDLWMYEVKVNFCFQIDAGFWCSPIYQLICVIMNREHATVNSIQQPLSRHDVIKSLWRQWMTDQSWSQSHEGQVISPCDCSLTELQPMTSRWLRLLFTCFEV